MTQVSPVCDINYSENLECLADSLSAGGMAGRFTMRVSTLVQKVDAPILQPDFHTKSISYL